MLDVAQPLPSFDSVTPSAHVKAVMSEKRMDVVGIRAEGIVTGFVETTDLTSGSCGEVVQAIDDSLVVSSTLPLGPLVIRLKDKSRLFVTTLGQICGLVTRLDIQRPPGRMWLFGMITLIEMRFNYLIAQYYPDETRRQFLSDGGIHKAQTLLELRRRQQHLSISECLQFADKIHIVASSEQLRSLTRFESKKQIEHIGKELENLRNNLAHSQDFVASDWATIVALAEQLDSILDGPGASLPRQS